LDAVCEVAGLEEDNAIHFLLDAARLKPVTEEITELARGIVKKLGYLALAIDQAGAYIAHGECYVYNFHETLERHGASLLSVSAYNRASPYKRAIYAMLELYYSAIQRMSTGELGQDLHIQTARDALQLLNMLMYFHYENVSDDIFRRAAKIPCSGARYPLDVDPRQELAGDKDFPTNLLLLDDDQKWDSQPFCKCVSLLSFFSLLWVNRLSGAISMHRLVHR
jgi:hypothetical protein